MSHPIPPIVLAGGVGVCFGFFLSQFLKPCRDGSDQKNKTTQTLFTSPAPPPILFGVVGGLGPQATAWFYSDGIIRGRARLHEIMVRKLTNAKQPTIKILSENDVNDNEFLTDLLEAVRQISSAEWTESEIKCLVSRVQSGPTLVDQDHVPLLLYSASNIPPRPDFILGKSQVDPGPALALAAASLANAGATHVAIVCSTAHYFLNQVQDAVPRNVQVVDMIDLALRSAVRLHSGTRAFGLLATEATIRTGIYTSAVNRINSSFRVISPLDLDSGQERQARIQASIFSSTGIKKGFDRVRDQPEARENLRLILSEALALARHLRNNFQAECPVILLGCTELPILVNEEDLRAWGKVVLNDPKDVLELSQMAFVDPGRVLADYIIKLDVVNRKVRPTY